MTNTLLSLDSAIFSHHITRSNGVSLHYVIGGQGEPVLLWHGFLETWYCWRKIMPALAKQYTVIAPDMRGYGDSEKPDTGYDAQTLMTDFRALIQQLGFSTIRILAHDMGAPPALLYAGQYPDEVDALVYMEEPVLTTAALSQLIAFTPEQTRNGGLWWWSMALAGDMAERLIIGHERAFLTWFYAQYTVDHTSIDDQAVNEYLRTFAGPDGVRGAFGVYRAIWTSVQQTEVYLSQPVKVPVLGLGGEMSQGQHVKSMLETVAINVQGASIPKCGHFPADEQPDILTRQIIEFFEKPSV